MSRLTFIIGGARSGKSDHAERIAEQSGKSTLYIATAQVLDEEMRSRIAAHRRRRPIQWETLELPMDVGRHLQAHIPQHAAVILDCLTLLVSNRLLQNTTDAAQPDQAAAKAGVEEEIEMLLMAIELTAANWIVVSNEVGQGVVPEYPLGRLFRDLLGWANKRVADEADEVLLMVAGIPVPIAEYRASGKKA